MRRSRLAGIEIMMGIEGILRLQTRNSDGTGSALFLR